MIKKKFMFEIEKFDREKTSFYKFFLMNVQIYIPLVWLILLLCISVTCFFTAIIQGGNLAEMHQQVKTVIANEQKKAIWVPVCPRV